jgi:aminoglycoside 3-N-acetyltransferase I
VALKEKQVVGGITGYELPMYLKEEKEMYLYDLAVDENYRRQGIASSLIEELKRYSKENNIKTIFVEAEEEDTGAVNFYKSLKAEELRAQHFNILID